MKSSRWKDAIYITMVMENVTDNNGKVIKDSQGKNLKEETWISKPFDPNRRKVADVMEAMRAVVHLPETVSTHPGLTKAATRRLQTSGNHHRVAARWYSRTAAADTAVFQPGLRAVPVRSWRT